MNKGKLRRVAIVALVLVLLGNTLGVQASIGAPAVIVSNYEELVQAVDQASNLDIILIGDKIQIPEGAHIGEGSKTVILKSSGGYMEIVNDAQSEEMTTFTSLVFDGAGKELSAPYLRITGTVEITSCTFRNCGATGAINMRYATCSIEDSSFKDNKGNYGAHLLLGYKCTADIKNSSFTGGVATVRGGGIYLDDPTCTATVTDCVITGNSGAYGGGIANLGSLTMSNTLLYGNTASVGGADLFSTNSYSMESIEESKEFYHKAGLEPLSWESDYTDPDYGDICIKLSYEEYIAPPAPTEPSTEPTEQPTEAPASTEEPTTEKPSSTEAPTTTETPTESPSTEQPNKGGDTYNDNHTEDNSTHTTTDDHSTSDSHTEDNSSHTSDSHDTTDSHNTTDNSTHSEDNSSHTDNSDRSTHTDNSTSSTTNVDSHNTTDSHNTDSHNTDSHDSSVSNIDNSVRSGDTNNITNSSDNSSHTGDTDSSVKDSNNNSTSNDNRSYTYNTDKSKTDNSHRSSYGSTDGSKPVNVTINMPESEKSENEAPTSPQPNINIYSQNVEVVYTASKDGGYSIDIKDKDSSGVVPVAYNTSTPLNKEESKRQQIPVYVNTLLLGILVVLEIKDRIASKKSR